MTPPHFFAPDVDGDAVRLRGEEARHASRVLRIRPGETISVGDGAGTVVTATVAEVGDEVVARVVERRTVPPPAPALTIWQGLPKSGKLEVAVQKLTEVGAMTVVPLRTERSVVRWDARAAARQVQRLRAVAKEAAKQSRRAWLPSVADVADLGAIPAGALVLHEEATVRLGAVLPATCPEAIALVVGPEGGFGPEEVEGLEARGCPSVSLGPRVLRTETAGLVAAAVVLARYGAIG